MDRRHLTGEAAENHVAAALQERGWSLLAQRLRTPFAEVDLVAVGPSARSLVVVEVKARHPLVPLGDEDWLRPEQRRRLGRALMWLAAQYCWNGPLRVDLACVEMVEQRVLAWRHYRGVVLAAGRSGRPS